MRVHCNICQHDTHHELLAVAEGNHEHPAWEDLDWDPNTPRYLRQRYSIARCKGCEEVCFLLEVDNQFTRDNPLEQIPFEVGSSTIFPPRIFRQPPRWFRSIPDDEIKSLLREVYAAIQNDSRRLAAMGVRCILDLVITRAVGDIDASGDTKSFGKKKQEYVRLTSVGRRTEDAIARVMKFGDAAIHRGFDPNENQITDAIDSLEHILHEAYVLPEATERLDDQTPIRTRSRLPKP